MAKKNPIAEPKAVENLRHNQDTRSNLPSAEQQPIMDPETEAPKTIRYPRNTDLDPQLMWRGKDEQDWSDLVVTAPPLFIQEKVHPKYLIDDLRRISEKEAKANSNILELFADFNGMPKDADRTEFYRHTQHWSNRMILGDSLQVMASLAEKEQLRGKVQCIYFDPPYGIKFNSNFQWSTQSRDVKDGNKDHITREPEQVKAFRDTWKDGINSYLTYLRDRLTVARDLLTDSGSIFVQIGDENVHRVRAVMDEVFGEGNFVSQIAFATTSGFMGLYLSSISDYILWYSKSKNNIKYRSLYDNKDTQDKTSKYKPLNKFKALSNTVFGPDELISSGPLTSQGESSKKDNSYCFQGKKFFPSVGLHWKTTLKGLATLEKASRIMVEGNSIRIIRFLNDFSVNERSNIWMDIGGVQSRTDPKVYVVQTATEAIKRCILMATDPGDLVLDPTCGSGTSAYVAEQWGRRWITIDTSRVALALARARIMGARYPYYLLADSREGQQKEAEITRQVPDDKPVYGSVRQGFVYERVPHITLKSIANNPDIDTIYDKWQQKLEPLLALLNTALGKSWEEWEVPRETQGTWPDAAKNQHSEWWQYRIARQKEIDASIASKADYEYLYDRPYEDKRKVRVAGPFTVESLSPHRMLGFDENDEIIDPNQVQEPAMTYPVRKSFPEIMLEELKMAGVQQANKSDKINFSSITPWPGTYICAEGRYMEGETERRAGIFIGPEFGTLRRSDLVEAAVECADAGFNVLLSCAFNYEAHTTEFVKYGKIQVLKARMNADLHMSADLKNTGKGNLFVIFGEPDIELLQDADGQIRVKVNGVDTFKPATGEVQSVGTEGIACWFIDTDYSSEAFFVRHAYFLGANDPYGSLKTTLKAEINPDAWATLNSDVSRPFPRPGTGRIAVKVINHLGDEVLKVFKV